jgi:hypothetical protein
MNELIELNPTEQFLANQNITMTLKEIADKYGKRHNDLKATFNLAVSKLSEENISYVQVVPVKVIVEKNNGAKETINSFTLDLRTMLWLMTKFDENMRMNVINFAFEKLEREKTLAIIEAKKPIMLANGMCSVRRGLSEAWCEEEEAPTESDIWNSLVWKGFCRTEAKVTVVRTIPESLNGHIGQMKAKGDVKYYPKTMRTVWEEFEQAGKPIKSEYERLKEEFKQVSEYYAEKIAEAKDKL